MLNSSVICVKRKLYTADTEYRVKLNILILNLYTKVGFTEM